MRPDWYVCRRCIVGGVVNLLVLEVFVFDVETVKLDLPLLLSAFSIIVSAIVGWSVIKSQKDQRRYHRVSTKPQLHLWLNADKQNGEVTLEIMNNGLGPGIIQGIEFWKRGGTGEPRVYTLEKIGYVLPNDNFNADRVVNASSLADPFSLAPAQRIVLLRIEFRDKTGSSPYNRNGLTAYMNKVQKAIGCRVRYSDVYGEEVDVVDP